MITYELMPKKNVCFRGKLVGAHGDKYYMSRKVVVAYYGGGILNLFTIHTIKKIVVMM